MEQEWNARVQGPVTVTGGLSLYVLQQAGIHRQKLLLEIDEWANKSRIYENFHAIEKARDKFLHSQGSDLTSWGYKDVLFDLHLMAEGDWSWGELSNFLNYQLLTLLLITQNEDGTKDYGDVGRYNIFTIFVAFGIAKTFDENEDFIDMYLLEIRQGNLPLSIGAGLLHRRLVRDKIRNLRSRIEKGRIHPPPSETYRNATDILNAELIMTGSYEQTNNFLQRSHTKEWKDSEDKINGILDKIQKMVDESSDPAIIKLRES